MAEGWHICMLPYKINKLTNAIQPLKIKEYLATGKPVISTPIKEAIALKDLVYIADSVKEWEECIQKLISKNTANPDGKIDAYLQEETWGKKADIFFKLCEDLRGSRDL